MDAGTCRAGHSDFQKLQKGKDCSEVHLVLRQMKGSGPMGEHQGAIQLLLRACNTLQCS